MAKGATLVNLGGAVTVMTDHPYLATVGSLASTLDQLAELEPVFLATTEKRAALVEVARLSSRVQALQARLIAAAGDVADAEGHRDVASWLTHRTRASGAASRRGQRLGVACDHRWHQLGAALLAGQVHIDQGHVMMRALDDLAGAADLVDASAEKWGEVLARAEAHLVEQAAHFGPRELGRLGERILEVVAPELADQVLEKQLRDAERRARRRTSLRMQSLADGTVQIKARVPETAAARLKAALESFTSPRRASASDGTDGSGSATLPYERRLGEAFCSLLEAMDPARLPLHGGDATTLVVTIDLAALTSGLGAATLADGSRISAGEARRLACTAGLVPAVLGTHSVPLDLGHTTRLFTPAQRKALAVRDRKCRADGCTIPSTWCEAHHLQPWSAGGRTDLENGLLLCAHHHHLIHDDRYLHDRMPNGDVRFTRRR